MRAVFNVTLEIGAAALDRVACETLLAQLALHSIARLKGQVKVSHRFSSMPSLQVLESDWYKCRTPVIGDCSWSDNEMLCSS